ncbi:MAG: hypothetical protein CBE00_00310 [Planctomycetaceae bacterium TMED240]|nr:hypothetical protein [Rhodopirellula sp.]OUX09031.1 MAG: hypothetical protein CBE00_00310 [Planctomycetaceae bacterium TMED240]
MMQPRPSDNQHYCALPVTETLVPSRPQCRVPINSAAGVVQTVEDCVVFGLGSRSARIDNSSHELSMKGGVAVGESRECLISQQKGHGWRIDSQHVSIDEVAGIIDKDRLATEVFGKEPDPLPLGLLSTQHDVFSGRSNAGERNVSVDVESRLQSSVQDYSVGVHPEVFCGLHDQVGEEILTALGIRSAVSSVAESLSVMKQSGNSNTERDSRSAECGTLLKTEEQGGLEILQTHPTLFGGIEFLHLSERLTLFSLSDRRAGNGGEQRIEFGELAFTGGVVFDAFDRGTTPYASEDAVGRVVNDVTLMHAVSVASSSKHRQVAAKVLNCVNDKRLLESHRYPNRLLGAAATKCNALEEERGDVFHFSPDLLDVRHGSVAGVRDKKLCFQHWAWSLGRESVRWFVGNLLLTDHEGITSEMVCAVADVELVGSEFEALDSEVLCGSWVARMLTSKPVDIHRVVLRLQESDERLLGSWVMMTPLGVGALESLGSKVSASAALDMPRCWARISEFQYEVGLLSDAGVAADGNVITFASGHGHASLGLHFSRDVQHECGLLATVVPSVDWVDPRRELLMSRYDGLRRPNALVSRFSAIAPVAEVSLSDCFNSAPSVADLEKNKSTGRPFLVVCASQMFERPLSSGLVSRVRTGPVYRSGVENFGSNKQPVPETCDSDRWNRRAGTFNVTVLDKRFLRGWAFRSCLAVERRAAVMARGEGIARFTPINVGTHDSCLSSTQIGRYACGIEIISDQKFSGPRYETHMVMRPVESAVTMQAATRFLFRHRGCPVWHTEDVSNLVLQRDSLALNRHYLSCGQTLDTDVDVGVYDSFDSSAACVLDVLAISSDLSDSHAVGVSRSVVISSGGTHACTLAHVPQYLNRAAWCRNATPLLVAASSQLNVAEHFFPPLRTFELPRLVMRGLFTETQGAISCGTLILPQERDVPAFSLLGNESYSDDSMIRLDVHGDRMQTGNVSLSLRPAVDCPTSLSIRRLGAADALRRFSDPLRSYLRANWSLIEVFGDCMQDVIAKPEGATRFFVMVDKRSRGFLRDRYGLQLVNQFVVEPMCFFGTDSSPVNSTENLGHDRLTQESEYRKALLPWTDIEVLYSASLEWGGLRETAVGGSVHACRSTGLPSLVEQVAIDKDRAQEMSDGIQIVWRPTYWGTLAEPDVVRFNLEHVVCTGADNKVESAVSPVLVEAAEGSSPITFNRSYRLDRITTHRHAGGLLSGTALQQSFDLSEKCRHVERTISISDRAA